jgi:tetratricopeptide (TPR) repeat protein
MYCHNCGYELDDSAIYCERCGVKLKKKDITKSVDHSLSYSEALSRYYDLEYDLEEINEKISTLSSKEALLEKLKRTREVKHSQLQQVQREMEEEKKDYQDLLKFSFAKIKAKLTGDVEEKKRKEHEEYLKALTNYEYVQKEYEELQDNIDDLQKEIADLHKLEAKKPEIVDEIDKLLEQLTEGKTTNTLDELVDNYQKVKTDFNQAKEIEDRFKQAESLVGKAEDHLQSAAQSMRSADSLGTWDTFLGGGIFVDGMKHGRLNEAKQDINQAQTLLSRAKDYVDIIDDLYIEFEVPNFFTDVFFDGFFFDMFRNAKISRTRQRVEEALYHLSQNRNKLMDYVNQWGQKKTDLISQINHIRKEIRTEREKLL